MGTPTNRTPVRVARGSTTALNTGLSDIQEGEIVWDTTLNKLQVKEGSALEDHTVDTSTLAPLASPTFTGTSTFQGQVNLDNDAGLFINGDIYIRRDSAANKNYIECTHADEHDLVIEVQDGKSITLQTDDGSFGYETLAKFQGDGAAELYYNGVKKLETTSHGVDVTGDADFTGHVTADNITNTANGTLTTNGQFTAAGQINLSDPGNSAQPMTMSTSGLKMMTGAPYVNRDVFEIGYSDIKLYGNNSLSLTVQETGVTVTGVATGGVYDATSDATSAAAAWAIDFADGNNQKVTLVSTNLLSVIPTNQTVGQSGSIFITQPGTPLNLGWHADWKWAGGTAPSLTQTGGATDRLDYVILAANTIHAVLTLAVA